MVAFVGISAFAQQEQDTLQDSSVSDVNFYLLEKEMWWALSSSGRLEDIIPLLERGLDPNVIIERSKGMTLFHFAVKYGRNLSLAVVRAFLEHGAHINTIMKLHDDLHYETAFDSAINSSENSAIIRFLSDNEAMTNYSRLHVAVRLEDIEAVRDLLDSGADPNVTDRLGLGLTPLHLAVQFSENLAITQILLAYGADPNAAPHPYALLKPIHRAAQYNSNPAITSILLEYGADVDSILVNGTSYTALFGAVFRENPEIVAALLEAGAEPNYHFRNDHPWLGGFL